MVIECDAITDEFLLEMEEKCGRAPGEGFGEMSEFEIDTFSDKSERRDLALMKERAEGADGRNFQSGLEKILR
jgi:hypothetical protein